MKRTYGVSAEMWDSMLLKQSGLCAICDIPMINPHIDYCHTQGPIRGLLCHRCNMGIGGFEDDYVLLRRAAFYCENSGGIFQAKKFENRNSERDAQNG